MQPKTECGLSFARENFEEPLGTVTTLAVALQDVYGPPGAEDIIIFRRGARLRGRPLKNGTFECLHNASRVFVKPQFWEVDKKATLLQNHLPKFEG